ISPSLESPAEVRGGILYVNPNALRGPPEQLKVIFSGHELFHLLNPDASEDQARLYTIRYLLEHNFLEEHLKWLKKNDIGLTTEIDWLASLQREDRILEFTKIIEKLISSSREKLTELILEYQTTTDVNKKKSLETQINSLIDQINALKALPTDELEGAEVLGLSNFLSNLEIYSKFLKLARETILSGKYVAEFIFAGAATRLLADLEKVLEQKLDPKDYRMYALHLWQVVKLLKDNLDLVRKNKPDLANLLESLEIPQNIPSLGMGQRQIVAYKKFIEQLAKTEGQNPEEALSRQKIILHINEEVADTVIDDFIRNDFYGFNPKNVFFIIQDVFSGFKLTSPGIIYDPNSPKLPYGHGYATMQLVHPNSVFRINLKTKEREYIPSDLLSYLISQNIKLIGTHRVNDLTKFLIVRPQELQGAIIELEKLAFGLYLLEQGNDIIVELVENPSKQKGGNLLQSPKTKKKFLIETSNTKGSPQLTTLLNQLGDQGSPYNAFRLLYNPESLKLLLTRGLPYNLRFKDGYLYLESVTGDITQLEEARTEAFKREGELIHDFKELKNLPEAVKYLEESDRQLKIQIDPARSKSDLPLSEDNVEREITSKAYKEYEIKHLPLLTIAKAKVANYITTKFKNKDIYLQKLNELLPDEGYLRAGPYQLFYGAVYQGILYLDEEILENPLHLDLTILHETFALAENSHQENLSLEEDYILSTIRSEGKYALDKLSETISEFIKEKSQKHNIDYLSLLKILFTCQPTSTLAQEIKEELVSRIIDAINLFEKYPFRDITTASIFKLEEFNELETYRVIAIQKILEGKIAFECFYAGSGERMGRGPLYMIDPWAIVEIRAKEDSSKIKDYKIPDFAIKGIPLGARQLIQLRIALEGLANQYNYSIEKVLSNFTIILHVNAQAEIRIKEDLIKHKHYGFNPENIIFVPQPVLSGWYIDKEGNVKLDTRSKTFPYNHGWARIQLDWENQAYWLDNYGNIHPISQSVIGYLLFKGIEYLTLNRINDLDRISKEGVLDIDLIALSIYLIENENYNLTVELVGNDTGEKGGLGLAHKDDPQAMFLVETLCSKSKEFEKRMNEFTEEAKKQGQLGVPYNAMRQVENISKTKEPMSKGLPTVIRYREKRIYIEIPVGDETNLEDIRAKAIMRMNDRFNPKNTKGELIYDFKKPEHAD
ncbi:MAG: hypothetical protein NC822_06570, partial [Candidatus Omnitrophica bacterium]|nr:hypothetical protein [Candidatus Omnitrophota bacterium]